MLVDEHEGNVLKRVLVFGIVRDEPGEVPANPTAIPDQFYKVLVTINLIRHSYH